MRRRWMRRRVKRRTQWLLSANITCAQLLRSQGCATEVSDPDTFLMVFAPSGAATQGSSGEVSDVVVTRLVGEWHLGGTVAVPTGTIQNRVANLVFAEGIYIADQPITSSTTVMDPSDSGDMISKDWMWMRTSVWQCVYSQNATAANAVFRPQNGFFNPHYDVKVKRKMRANEAIVYAIAAYLDASATVDPPGAGPLGNADVSAYVYGSGRALVTMP